MKKTKLINAQISKLIAELGHTDEICLADAGLPIPQGVARIDVAITLGLPKFLDVLEIVASEAHFEEVIFSKNIKEHYPNLINKTKAILGKNIKVTFIDHEDFKLKTKNCKGIIRTGENKVFHNIILKSGVTF